MQNGQHNSTREAPYLARLRKWCSRRERASREVLGKAYELGVSDEDAVAALAQLQAENFQSDERFCEAYVRSSFEIRRWGRVKIRAALRSRGLPSGLISSALTEISDDAFLTTCCELAEKRRAEVRLGGAREKTMRWLLGKGFTHDEVLMAVNLLAN